MKFSIGDKVVLKQTNEEGEVKAYINNEMFEVEVDGVSFPVHKDELDHPYLKWFTEKKIPQTKKVVPEQLPVEKTKLRKPRLAKGIYLSFMPEYKLEEMEDVVDVLKVYLLNETPKEIHYRYEMTLLNESHFEHEGKLHEFGHVYLHSIPYEQMNDQPRFNWSLDDREDADMAPANGQLRIKPQKLFQHIDNCLTNNEPSFNYMLVEDFKPVVIQKEHAAFTRQEKPQKANSTQKKNVTTPLPQTEVDLHIENLVSSTRGMSNTDILMTQLGTLETHLRMAINAHQERLIVIHGLGKGKLRDEVHKLLSETPEVKSFTNDFQGRYGFGATEVWFKY